MIYFLIISIIILTLIHLYIIYKYSIANNINNIKNT